MIAEAPAQKLFEFSPDDARIPRLEEVLRVHGWQTRAELVKLLNWSERDVRGLVEAAPDKFVCGQKGFALTSQATADELSRAAEQSINQSQKMLAKGLIWRKLAHQKVG